MPWTTTISIFHHVELFTWSIQGFLWHFSSIFLNAFISLTFKCWKNTFENLDQMLIFSYFEHNKVSRKYQALKDLESSLTKKLLKNAQMLIFWKKIKSMKLKKSIFSLLLPSNCFPFLSHCSKHSINFNPMKSQDFWFFFCYFKKLYWFHGGAR